MARYIGAMCRLCRREGEKLFLKGDRCFTSKCAVERRQSAPGQHGKARQSRSDYKEMLREKQKTKRMYGLVEKQFRSYFEKASRTKGVTGTELLSRLETRLDNVAYRLGFGVSRRQCRQLIGHGHVLVNGKKVDIASFHVAVGDIVEVRGESKNSPIVRASMEATAGRIIPEWLSLDKAGVKGTINALPAREQMPQNVREQLIVELYSK